MHYAALFGISFIRQKARRNLSMSRMIIPLLLSSRAKAPERRMLNITKAI